MKTKTNLILFLNLIIMNACGLSGNRSTEVPKAPTISTLLPTPAGQSPLKKIATLTGTSNEGKTYLVLATGNLENKKDADEIGTLHYRLMQTTYARRADDEPAANSVEIPNQDAFPVYFDHADENGIQLIALLPQTAGEQLKQKIISKALVKLPAGKKTKCVEFETNPAQSGLVGILHYSCDFFTEICHLHEGNGTLPPGSISSLANETSVFECKATQTDFTRTDIDYNTLMVEDLTVTFRKNGGSTEKCGNSISETTLSFDYGSPEI